MEPNNNICCSTNLLSPASEIFSLRELEAVQAHLRSNKMVKTRKNMLWQSFIDFDVKTSFGCVYVDLSLLNALHPSTCASVSCAGPQISYVRSADKFRGPKTSGTCSRERWMSRNIDLCFHKVVSLRFIFEALCLLRRSALNYFSPSSKAETAKT